MADQPMISQESIPPRSVSLAQPRQDRGVIHCLFSRHPYHAVNLEIPLWTSHDKMPNLRYENRINCTRLKVIVPRQVLPGASPLASN